MLRNSSAFISWPEVWSVKALCWPTMVPVGELTFQLRIAVSTSLMPIWRAASACGSSCACTAYFWLPSTWTCATPDTIEMRCAMRVSAYSSSVHGGIVVDVITRYRIGWSAGLTLVKVGGVGMPCGSRRAAWVIAPCTSTAAASRLRFKSNSRVICVDPSELTDVIDSSPAIIENWFSSGVATDAPIVSGLAPGNCAVTSSVGKSTFDRSLTGSDRYATRPNSAIAAISRLVAIGRLMNPSEMFTDVSLGSSLRAPFEIHRSRDSDGARRLQPSVSCVHRLRDFARFEHRRHVGVDDRRQV